MKTVVIGGGIAGLTMAILLRKQKQEVVVCERNAIAASHGHAFLMSMEGLSILREFKKDSQLLLKKQPINLFNLRRPDGTEKIKIQLEDWFCMKRVDLIEFLMSFFDENTLKTGRSFSHFIYNDNKAIAAVFENGDIEYGDIFIGADGSNSKVRESLFGSTAFTANEVNEVVGISTYNAIQDKNTICFRKFQSDEVGLAFGYIPVSDKEVVWFMQYDLSIPKEEVRNSPESIASFCMDMMSTFPQEVLDVLNGADFSNSYIWKTKDFDILPRFHESNVVLIGDAAHLALPFTSAGSSNAISDACYLAEMLKKYGDCENAFQEYYAKRAEIVRGHVEQGRQLKQAFLNPEKYSERSFLLPLIKREMKVSSLDSDNLLKIVYFTDPICSTCWIIQPILRKLKLVFGEQIHLEYYMGGLLPSWKDYNKGIIKNPLDAAKHWDEVNSLQDYYLSGDIWIDDPLHSSFPPSIAFKAAQIQDNERAIRFLRRMKEMVFIENKNITRWDVLEEAALASGLDTALLKQDMKSRGEELFNEDLRFKDEMRVSVFPTFFFIENDEISDRISGYQPYERFKEIISRLRPQFVLETRKKEPIDIFRLFGNITTEEYAFLNDIAVHDAAELLEGMYNQHILRKQINNKGIVWILKSSEI